MNQKVYEILKERILKMLEESKETGKLIWIKPWKTTCPLAKPYFSDQREYYQGINLVINEPGEYMTYKMISEMHEKDSGVKLRKGAKQHTVFYYNFMDRKDEEGKVVLDENGEPQKIPFLKFYKVYNIDDVEKVNSRIPYEHNEHTIDEDMEKADKYIKKYCELNGIDLQIKEGGQRAYYRPSANSITIPDKSQYKSIREYYSTCFHELSHAVDNKLKLIGDEKEEKDSEYASGELLAEISANILCNIFHIEDDMSENNNLAYINGWYEHIKDRDGSYIARVATKATKAAMHFVDSVELELLKEEAINTDHMVVYIETEQKFIVIDTNADGDFDYTIYKYTDGSNKMIDGGIIECSDDISNAYDVAKDIIDDLNIQMEAVKVFDSDTFENIPVVQYESIEEL